MNGLLWIRCYIAECMFIAVFILISYRLLNFGHKKTTSEDVALKDF